LQRRSILFVLAITLTILAGWTSHIRAGYSIRLDGPTSISANTAFSIDIYLVENVGAGVTILGDSNQGLLSGSFQVILTGTSNITKVVGNSSSFDTYGGDAIVAPWVITQVDLDPNDGTPTGTSLGMGVYELLLGTIQGVSAGVIEVTQFTVTGLENPGGGGSSDDMILGDSNATVLDDDVFPSGFSLSVTGGTVVPEPTSMAIFGLGALVLAYRARRKAKA